MRENGRARTGEASAEPAPTATDGFNPAWSGMTSPTGTRPWHRSPTRAARDPTTYILDILTAVLASEPSPALTKLFDVWDNVLDVLIRGGEWTQLETVLTMLPEAETVRPDLADSHKQRSPGCSWSFTAQNGLKTIG